MEIYDFTEKEEKPKRKWLKKPKIELETLTEPDTPIDTDTPTRAKEENKEKKKEDVWDIDLQPIKESIPAIDIQNSGVLRLDNGYDYVYDKGILVKRESIKKHSDFDFSILIKPFLSLLFIIPLLMIGFTIMGNISENLPTLENNKWEGNTEVSPLSPELMEVINSMYPITLIALFILPLLFITRSILD